MTKSILFLAFVVAVDDHKAIIVVASRGKCRRSFGTALSSFPGRVAAYGERALRGRERERESSWKQSLLLSPP